MLNNLPDNGCNVLVLAPHTDDAELGCGGTIARLVRSGAQVYVAAFSTAEDSLPEGTPSSTLRDEFMAAMGTMCIPDQHLFVYAYPVRRLSYHRQEVLEDIVGLRAKVKPDVVLLPADSDLHQDHQVVNAEGLRAFKDRTTWGYELPWNHITFSAQAFVTLHAEDVDLKWAALQNYHSQIELARPYFTRGFIDGLARLRGVQVKAEFAEAFQVFRMKW